jgi:hypothetical protein
MPFKNLKTMAKKSDKIIVGKPPSQINGPYWRKDTDNVTEQISKLPRPTVVSYMKVIRKVRGGTKTDIQFWKTLSNGYMVYVDVTNCKIGVVQGLSGNTGFMGATKKEYNTAFNKVLNQLK